MTRVTALTTPCEDCVEKRFCYPHETVELARKIGMKQALEQIQKKSKEIKKVKKI